jgi:hypothetical protein
MLQVHQDVRQNQWAEDIYETDETDETERTGWTRQSRYGSLGVSTKWEHSMHAKSLRNKVFVLLHSLFVSFVS